MADSDVRYYLGHISAYEREFKTWEGRVRKIIKRYRSDEYDKADGARFNVLWSNVQTLKAATYARTPEPDVSRRFRDNDPVGRVAGLIIERALDFEVKNYPDFSHAMRSIVYDRFLGGRGTAWVRYHPITRTETQYPSLEVTDEEQEPQEVEVLDWEATPTDYVHWSDFGHSVARTWEEVSVVWRKVYMSRKAMVDRFGDAGKRVPLDSVPNDKVSMKADDSEGVGKRGLIYEIWDKDEGKALWLSKSLDEILEEREDPLQLEGFFPCPRPIFSTLTTETLVPVPDYIMYQDQARELDKLADRIDGLIEALKVRGVYDASQPDLARLFKEGDNGDLIPVNNWQAFAEKKGLAGSIDLVEILPIAQALNEAYKAFDMVKGEIYEITGISDILRGQTAPSETATAQQIKNSYASLRLKTYQDEVERFACDVFRIKADIICKHFDPQTLLQMAAADQFSQVDQQLIPAAIQLLKQNPMREFRIEVETDSMAFQDEQQDKQDRMQFLQATSQFMQQISQAGQENPQLLQVGVELLKFGVAGFRIGKNIEGIIDQAAESIGQQAQNPKPNPEMAKVQAQAQANQAKLQSDTQLAQQKLQADIQLAQAKAQADQQTALQKAHADAELEQTRIGMQQQSDQMQRQYEAQIEQMKLEAQAQQAATQLEFDRWKAQLDADTKLMVAEISAGASIASSTAKDDTGASKPAQSVTRGSIAVALTDAIQGFREAVETHSETMAKSLRPRTVIRDETGRISGLQ